MEPFALIFIPCMEAPNNLDSCINMAIHELGYVASVLIDEAFISKMHVNSLTSLCMQEIMKEKRRILGGA